jgi:hypothetical protein
MRMFAALVLCLVMATPALAQMTTQLPQARIPRSSTVDDPEMSAIFAADQADRGVNRKTKSAYVINWSVVSRADKKRRLAVRKIMTAGRLGTAKDFERAAYVFQHGQDPDDYLLAHVLAVVAVEKGDKDATWVSAATLDRYLGAIGRKQIFGTQFFISKDAKVTQEPYDRGLISDSLRASSHVIPQSEQEKILLKMAALEKAANGG